MFRYIVLLECLVVCFSADCEAGSICIAQGFNLMTEPIFSGNLPPSFDSSACCSVLVWNIHPQVTDPLLQEVFSRTGIIARCQLIRQEKSSYGFVDYYDRRSAALAIVTLNGLHLFGLPIKVNWAHASSLREDKMNHHNIFVWDLVPEVTDATLFACFSHHTCSDARVMWDKKTGRSRGFGFVSFRSQQDAQTAINDLDGKLLGSRQIRCKWAPKGSIGSDDDEPSPYAKSAVDLTNGSSEDGQEKKTDDHTSETNPQVDGPFDYCYCGAPVSRLTAWTHENPGRKFIACKYYDREMDARRCNYFMWLDLDSTAWQRDVINHLLVEKRLLEKRLMKIEMNVMMKKIEEFELAKKEVDE
ncbi:oligouridylate-binding protein 1 isoform X2 [Spinacia oleracea]|uniref:Oligouridylate-binding protein 1 isoform X2 n=1 Tax=Spinacia oleracea TaxID=3562 RepID=A0A9R0IMI3_SPIOL|nr:oligouridylate-binding protein 1-like isoform X2 [Spinacia oleracea]